MDPGFSRNVAKKKRHMSEATEKKKRQNVFLNSMAQLPQNRDDLGF